MTRRGRKAILRAAVLALAVVCAGRIDAQDAAANVVGGAGAIASGDSIASSGTGAVTLSPVTGSGTDGQWQVSLQGEAGYPVTGTVQVTGFTVRQPGRLGKVDWQRSGNDIAGTIGNPSGGTPLASFNGIVNANGAQGTFSAANGQTGSWSWTGAAPQLGSGAGSPSD